MKELPQLEREQLNKWKTQILGQNSKKFPESFLFEQLFFERSPLSRGKLLSERIAILIKKFPQPDTYRGLQIIFPDTLKYLRDNNFLDETSYKKEYEKCMNLIKNSSSSKANG